MSTVRQRRGQDAPGPGRDATSGNGVANAPVTKRETDSVRTQLTFAGLAWFVAGIVYVALRYGQAEPPPPGAYALCSPEGQQVYTVDATHPKARCFVVNGEYFVDVGTLGKKEHQY